MNTRSFTRIFPHYFHSTNPVSSSRDNTYSTRTHTHTHKYYCHGCPYIILYTYVCKYNDIICELCCVLSVVGKLPVFNIDIYPWSTGIVGVQSYDPRFAESDVWFKVQTHSPTNYSYIVNCIFIIYIYVYSR